MDIRHVLLNYSSKKILHQHAMKKKNTWSIAGCKCSSQKFVEYQKSLQRRYWTLESSSQKILLGCLLMYQKTMQRRRNFCLYWKIFLSYILSITSAEGRCFTTRRVKIFTRNIGTSVLARWTKCFNARQLQRRWYILFRYLPESDYSGASLNRFHSFSCLWLLGEKAQRSSLRASFWAAFSQSSQISTNTQCCWTVYV